jgi:prepilin-type N-terminal cleavage/methylation domain-containing protein
VQQRTTRGFLPSRRAFTLVELMIVVAIIGILSTVAVPNYQEFVLRAKKSETYVCLNGIRTAEFAYEAAFDTYVAADPNPPPPLKRIPRQWDMTVPGWSALNWSPTGAVRCSYQVVPRDGGSWFYADAYCDIDGDEETALVRIHSWRSGSGSTFEEPYPQRY